MNTKKIKLSELKGLVRKIIKEEMMNASDGGYYSGRDTTVYATEEDVKMFKKVVREFGRSVANGEEGIHVDNSTIGNYNQQIIKYLKKHIGIEFEYENDEGTDFYYITSEEDRETVLNMLDDLHHIFYDKVLK